MRFAALQKRAAKSDATAHAQEEAPELESVDWTKDPGLRKLMFYCLVLSIGSSTTGYDG